MITSGEGKYKVTLEEKKIGKNILYILSGGEKPHIGGVVICEIENAPQVITLGSHFDHIVLEPIAKRGCEKNQTTVVAIGGMHIDNATKKEIEIIKNHCNIIKEQL
ncbi:MAG: hypothetical protein DRN27_07215 [Thermoplasmata archaeon]|nr:MAG: hypothetical protein DRN27_07215 [Thermoplasmata archaeon]